MRRERERHELEWMLQRVTAAGDLQWATSLKDLAVAPSEGQVGGTWLTVLGGKTYVTFQGSSLVVDTRSGAPLDEPASPHELVRNDGSVAVQREGEVVWQTDPNDWVSARVDGALVTAREGASSDTTLSVYDVATSETLWSDTRSGDVPLAAGSVLLFTGGDTLAAVEARTGETLWVFGTQALLDYATTADGIIVHLGSELARLSWPR